MKAHDSPTYIRLLNLLNPTDKWILLQEGGCLHWDHTENCHVFVAERQSDMTTWLLGIDESNDFEHQIFATMIRNKDGAYPTFDLKTDTQRIMNVPMDGYSLDDDTVDRSLFRTE